MPPMLPWFGLTLRKRGLCSTAGESDSYDDGDEEPLERVAIAFVDVSETLSRLTKWWTKTARGWAGAVSG